MAALNPNLTSFPGATPQQLLILNQVAGSNSFLANALAGNPNANNSNAANPATSFFGGANPLPGDPFATGLYDLGKAVDQLLGDPFTGSTFSSGNGNTVSGFFDFIGDIQRVGTFLVGIILVAGGIFALSKGPIAITGGLALKRSLTS